MLANYSLFAQKRFGLTVIFCEIHKLSHIKHLSVELNAAFRVFESGFWDLTRIGFANPWTLRSRVGLWMLVYEMRAV